MLPNKRRVGRNNGMNYLAIDLGASSGRGIIGRFDGEKLTLEEIHRFSNDPVSVCGTLYWDILRIFHEIKAAIGKCSVAGERLESFAIDTWGVDYGLLDKRAGCSANQSIIVTAAPTAFWSAQTSRSESRALQRNRTAVFAV